MRNVNVEASGNGNFDLTQAYIGRHYADNAVLSVRERMAAVDDPKARAALQIFEAAQGDPAAVYQAAKELEPYLDHPGVREAAGAISVCASI